MTSLDQPDTEELLRRAGAGDGSAVQQLLARHRKRLRRTIAVRMDPKLAARIDPSDVIQDVLLEASCKLPEYARRRPLPFYPWLRQLAWDRLADLYHQHVRARKRDVAREEIALPDRSAIQLVRQLVDTGTGPAQKFLREELQQRVQAALSRLDPEDREVLVMRHLEQMRIGEIASVLGISEGAVKMRRLRAIQRLRDLLDGGWEESQT